MKRFVSIVCSTCLLALPLFQTVGAVNVEHIEAMNPKEIYLPNAQSRSEPYHDTIVIDDGTEEGYVISVEIADGIVKTEHTEDDGSLTVMSTDTSTGVTTTEVFQDGEIAETYSEKSQGVAEAQEAAEAQFNARASGYIWNSSYTNIGSVTYKANVYTGEKMTLHFQARETGHFFQVSKSLSGVKGKTVQAAVHEFIDWAEIKNLFVLVSTASEIVSSLISKGILTVMDGLITAVLSPSVTATGMNYDVKAKEPVGGITITTEGCYFQCVSGSKMNEIFTEGYYPQFIKEKDKYIASTFFSYFRDGGYDGVEKFSATITVPYK